MYSTHTRHALCAQHLCRSQRGTARRRPDAAGRAVDLCSRQARQAIRALHLYIPTIDVLRGLRKEGFEPFMVAQGQSRVEGKAEFTKHMIRMRH